MVVKSTRNPSVGDTGGGLVTRGAVNKMNAIRMCLIVILTSMPLLADPAGAQVSFSSAGGQAPQSKDDFTDSLNVDLNIDGYNSRPGTSGRFDCWSSSNPRTESVNPSLITVCITGEYGDTTTDFDRVDDARAFTSEALFAQSALRLNRPLTREELRAIARVRDEFETRDHLTLALDNMTHIDFFFRYRDASSAQITDFYLPTQTNSVDFAEYGIYAEKSIPLLLNNASSVTFGLGYSRVKEEGLVEFLPRADEYVDQYSARFGVQGNAGSGKLVLNANYDYQNIDADIPQTYSQSRSIYGARLAYFDNAAVGPSTWSISIGAAHDIEWYASVGTPKNDYFVGMVLYGTHPFGLQMPVNVSIIPAVLTSANTSDKSQVNAQYRTNLLIALPDIQHFSDDNCIFDTLSLSFPFRQDVAFQGPSWFDNYRAGAHIDMKMRPIELGGGLPSARLWLSVGYDFQYFYNINKPLNQLGIRLSAGF